MPTRTAGSTFLTSGCGLFFNIAGAVVDTLGFRIGCRRQSSIGRCHGRLSRVYFSRNDLGERQGRRPAIAITSRHR